MLFLKTILVVLLILVLLLKFSGLILKKTFVAAAMNSDYAKRRAAEERILEQADWIGKTGLFEQEERELPRYLRRELHEFLDEPDGLKAADLVYLGLLKDSRGQAHFWRMPTSNGEPAYAYIEINDNGIAECMGWGDRQPDK